MQIPSTFRQRHFAYQSGKRFVLFKSGLTQIRLPKFVVMEASFPYTELHLPVATLYEMAVKYEGNGQ